MCLTCFCSYKFWCITHFQTRCKYHKHHRMLIMKNQSNGTYNGSYVFWSIPHVVAFEVSIVISSVLIVVTSSLVIHNIHCKVTRSRADFLFIVISISDIGVGLLSQPSIGLYVLCLEYFECNESMYFVEKFFFYFPWDFSYLVTTTIALDTLLVVTKQRRYEKIITKRRLKTITALFFILSLGFRICYRYIPYKNRGLDDMFYVIYLIINLILPMVIITAYIYILCFVFRSSRAMSDCKKSGVRASNRLTKTIMSIFISQFICIVPDLILAFKPSRQIASTYKVIHLLIYWFAIFKNNQCFCNGIILLINQRRKFK